ncbi:MAG: glucosaminidase domain-containing protein [Sphingobacteriales bacterium]|jgi:hypothetical protein
MIKAFILTIFSFCLFLNPTRSQKLDTDIVFAYICKVGIKHPEIVIRQALLETGNFKSPYLMNKNNLFGFKHNTYLSFNSWKESVEYYKKWQDKRYKNDKEDYYTFLVRIKYARSTAYISKLKKFTYTNSCK